MFNFMIFHEYIPRGPESLVFNVYYILPTIFLNHGDPISKNIIIGSK